MEKKVRVTTREMDGEGIYEGVLHTVDKKSGEIVLSKVTCASGKKLMSLQHFFSREIIDIQEINDNHDYLARDKNNMSAQKTPVDPVVARTLLTAISPQCDLSNGQRRDPSDDGIAMLDRMPVQPAACLIGDGERREHLVSTLHEPPKLVIINKLDTLFDEMIASIKAQRVVGVACEGCGVGRLGCLSLLIIGCRSFTCVFDIIAIGKEGFDKGLGDILQDENILKVIHDCRLLSDCIYHQFNFKLCNIFDTQVAHTIISKTEKGVLPDVVIPLVPCYFEYLNLAPERCRFKKVMREFVQKNPLIWKERPLPPELLCAAAEQVVYLRELRLAEMERMMAEFLFGVDVYLSCIRDAPEKIARQNVKLNRLPKEFTQLPAMQKERWLQFRRKGNTKTRREDEHVTEKIDGLWKDGGDFVQSYENKHGRVVEFPGENISAANFHLAPVKRQLSPSASPIVERNINAPVQSQLSASAQSFSPTPVTPMPQMYAESAPLPAEEITIEDEDLPPLNGGTPQLTKEHMTPKSSPFDLQPEAPKSMGRGKVRDFYINSASKKGSVPGQTASQPRIIDGTSRQSMPFPPDQELINTPYVTAVDSHVHGESVVLKRRQTNDDT